MPRSIVPLPALLMLPAALIAHHHGLLPFPAVLIWLGWWWYRKQRIEQQEKAAQGDQSDEEDKEKGGKSGEVSPSASGGQQPYVAPLYGHAPACLPCLALSCSALFGAVRQRPAISSASLLQAARRHAATARAASALQSLGAGGCSRR